MINKNRYRNVCDPHRERQMAFEKIAGVFVKDTGQIDPGWTGYELLPPRQPARLKPLVFGLLLALVALLLVIPEAFAQIVAYRNAPATQQATVLNAANGIPLVNIQTPSAAGVSRNSYSQFDVQQPGAILNNSPTNAQTQLGGWVQGNPWLAGGSARVILNEIFSANPSQLLGYVEVAGNGAQVIIANPTGITCNACGFINASRATLTTGTPIFNNGNLEGYRVEGGSIRIEGAGMDTSGASHTDLIARAVEVNAGLWANSLRITTGSNRIDAEHTLATPIASNASATTPAFAIDVAQLGGMYAGKIVLVGTEAGVGVRNAGHIGASAGEVVITADGLLHNSGRIGSAGQTQINASRGIDNSGTVYAQGDAVLTTRGLIDNSGVIAAQGNTTLSASGAGSHISGTAGSVLGAGINPDGSFGNSARLDVGASENVALHGQNLSTGDQFITGSTLDLSNSQSSSRNLTLSAANGNLDARRALLAATGTLSATAAQSLLHDNASSSAENLQLAAHDMSNVHGELVQTGSGDTAIALAGTLNNSQGRLASNGRNFILSAPGIDNTEGSIVHAGDGSLDIHANTFTSTRGSLGSNGLLDLVASSFMLDAGSAVARLIRIDVATLSSQGGEIAQTGTGNTLINASSGFFNEDGKLISKGQTSMTLGRLENRGGTLSASGGANLTLNTSGLLENAGGFIGADGEVQLAAQSIGNRQGRITAVKSLQATASQGIDNTQGLLAANGNLNLHSASLDNTLGTMGSVHGNVTANAGAGRLANSAGRIEAAQDITLAGTGLSNTDGIITGRNLRLDSRSQALDNSRGTLSSAGTLELHSGTLTNDFGLIQASGALTINTHGQTLSNTNSGASGGILGQNTVTLATGDLANVAGFIGAKGMLEISSSAIANTAGASLSSEQDIRISGTSLDNRGGQIQALGSTRLQIGATVNNASSLIRAGQTLDMTAGRIINSATRNINQGIEGRSVNLSASEIDNSSGALRANQTLTLTSGGTINNSGGLISSAQILQILDPQAAPTGNSARKTLAVTNSGGLLIADQLLSLDSASLSGDGSVLGQGDVSVKLISDFTHTGQFAASGNAALETTGTLTNRARMQAGNSLRLTAATLYNEASGEIVAGTLRLIARDAHTLTNRGLIDGHDTFIDTPTLNNLGSGRIYGDHIAIAATTLNNDAENSVAPVIAARENTGRLDIGAQTINNREHALLFSAGDLTIGGALDASHQATGQAGSLDNISASIEALGTLSINVGALNNKRSAFSSERRYVGTETAYSQRCDNPPSCTYISYITDQTTRYQDVVTTTATAASIRVGGHASLNATNLVNEYSSIEAGGNFNLTGSTLTNQGAELYLQTDLIHSEHPDPLGESRPWDHNHCQQQQCAYRHRTGHHQRRRNLDWNL
ncbi:MAG: filamentous hemagglutinin N-terminal domain-containing protein [Propionivibrio sp.]|nr:filamentous hemagglutinin N-terminal domain-containing protein [Propionivibrio sp.]